MLLRLALAAGCGIIIGLEREHRHQSAGIKTHTLVCMGAALVSMIQIQMINDIIAQVQMDPSLSNVLKSDYGRLGAQVISGIGFLGAGTILHNKGSVKGLTTAATLWAIACVGLAVGMGYYLMSVIAVGLIEIIIITIRIAQGTLQKKHGNKLLEIVMENKREAMNFINDFCLTQGIVILNIEFIESNDVNEISEPKKSNIVNTYQYSILLPRTMKLVNVLAGLQIEDSIRSASVV